MLQQAAVVTFCGPIDPCGRNAGSSEWFSEWWANRRQLEMETLEGASLLRLTTR